MEIVTKPSGIKALAPADRPRERLQYQGAAILSNAELLAILIGSGTPEMNALELCEKVLAALDHDLERLAGMSVADLCRFKGIGEARAVTLLAAMELAARVKSPGAKTSRLEDHFSVAELLWPVFRKTTERAYVLVLLNARQELLATCELAIAPGGVPDTAGIIRLAMDAGAARLVLACNEAYREHKSFTKAEKAFFRELKAAADMAAMRLDGMLIIGETEVRGMDE